MKHINLKYSGIFMLWLMHISGFIGINLGYSDFFLPLSALNLWFIFSLLVFFYPIKKIKQVILFSSIAISGFVVEAVGVATGQIFGEYTYGNNLGLKLADVPIIIGVNWAILSFVTAEIADSIKLKSTYLKALISSGLMLFFDIFIEQSAPRFDFWAFELPSVPLQNYITWFVLAYIFSFEIQIQSGHRNILSYLYCPSFIFYSFLCLLKLLITS
ncbi:MAG: carotenoid biosynthesis protein [Bacteroidetes bacterium]|nr:carotenoid biosynthesis protein [Bacteroidota bacterium]